MATKRVIVLERLDDGTGPQVYRYAMWADVPATRQPFYAGTVTASQWEGASTAENTALASGSVVERVDSIIVPPATSLAAVQSALLAAATAYQAYITAYNPWLRYGTYHDGTSWTAGGVS